MKKNIIILMIIFLISFTTIIKNTSKKLENDIFNKRENLILLERKYSLILLENNYLTSPRKLFSYSENLEKENYYPIDIMELNKVEFFENKIQVQKFINYE